MIINQSRTEGDRETPIETLDSNDEISVSGFDVPQVLSPSNTTVDSESVETLTKVAVDSAADLLDDDLIHMLADDQLSVSR